MSKNEIIVNQVREQIVEYLTRAERGEVTAIKRYRTKIAKIMLFADKSVGKLPDLSVFRKPPEVSSDQPAGDLLRKRRNGDR